MQQIGISTLERVTFRACRISLGSVSGLIGVSRIKQIPQEYLGYVKGFLR